MYLSASKINDWISQDGNNQIYESESEITDFFKNEGSDDDHVDDGASESHVPFTNNVDNDASENNFCFANKNDEIDMT